MFSKKLDQAISRWDRWHAAGVPDFADLPGGWQTVWLSRVYQGKTASFSAAAFAGHWRAAIAALRADNEYAERTNQEADLLETELPPPVKAPGAKTK